MSRYSAAGAATAVVDLATSVPAAGSVPVDYSIAAEWSCWRRKWPVGDGTQKYRSHSRRQPQLAGLEPVVGPVPVQSVGQLCSRKERHSLDWYLLGEREREREIREHKTKQVTGFGSSKKVSHFSKKNIYIYIHTTIKQCR